MADTFTPTNVVPGTWLGTSAAVLYQVPTGASLKISQLVVTNTDTSNAHQVSVYLTPNANAPGSQTLIWRGYLAVNQSLSVYQAINQVLGAGGAIQAYADTQNIVNIAASGWLVS